MTMRPIDDARLNADKLTDATAAAITVSATSDTPLVDVPDGEQAPSAFVDRDPRAGQATCEHKVGLTLYAAAAPSKVWRAPFTLPQIATIIRARHAFDGAPMTGLSLTGLSVFSGIVASHRGGVIGLEGAIEALQRRNVRGIVFAPVDEDGWRVAIPLSGARAFEMYELFAARAQGLFAGRLDPTVFDPSHVISIGGVRHVKVVDGEFIDRNDYTYRTSIFRDGSTVASRAAAVAAKPKKPKQTADVIPLPVESIAITELSPNYAVHAGKSIGRNGRLSEYPRVAFWHQRVVEIPARINALANYLQDARATRNVVIIRGKPANFERAETRRQIAWIKNADGSDRGDHGFEEQLSRAFFLDIDRAVVNWRGDADGAIRWIKSQLGEPFASASCAWIFTGTHGLETETVDTGRVDADNKPITYKRWTGNIVDGVVRARLAFVTDRPLSGAEVAALTQLAQAASAEVQVDPCITNLVQPNYIRRMLWEEHPNRDPLRDIPTAGVVEGAHEFLTVPEGLAVKARWQAAQGHGGSVASHPSAIAAVLAVGTDQHIRHHLTSAIGHLAHHNPLPKGVEIASHAVTLATELHELVRANEAEITANLAAHNRRFEEVLANFPKGMTDFAVWKIPRGGQPNRKTIELAYEARDDETLIERQVIVDRVRRTIHGAEDGVTLLIAPTGTFKSTEVRKAAVAYVLANPGKTAVLLVPRHDLGAEQIRKLHEEHPDADFTCAVWRGRHREDPEFIGPLRVKETKTMCHRPAEAAALEMHLVDVGSHLCQRGRGENKVKCDLFDRCGAQRQRHTVANIWVGAHELITHELPETFGDVGRIFIDEDPLDAFMFGLSENDKVVIPLDALKKIPGVFKGHARARLKEGRLRLHGALDGVTPPENEHLGAPVTREILGDILDDVLVVPPPPAVPLAPAGLEEANRDIWDNINLILENYAAGCGEYRTNLPAEMTNLEWRDKVDPPIRPNMDAEQIEELLKQAAGNAMIKKIVTLWKQLGHAGRVQIRQSDKGRNIHVIGLREVAKGWRDIPILITDATADATLLRYIWPELKCEVEEWEQLPRPASVKVFQCVDRALSMDNIAVYGEGEKLKAREDAARRTYAAILGRAMAYGDADVGVIIYKSTKDWIKKNCFVPPWLKFLHHGSVSGVNILEKARALFNVGRLLPSAEAVTRMTEALTGEYLPKREYERRVKGGRIRIKPTARGHNLVKTDVWEHPHPIAERIRRQVTEASGNQNEGRARASLRGETSPLDVHRWHDVALPELGEVEAVLWDEVKGDLDELMLAVGGVWLKNKDHAAAAYSALMTAEGLKKSRQRSARSGDIPYRESLIGNVPTPQVFHYQLTGKGQKPVSGVSLLDDSGTRAFLEMRVGPLTAFRQVQPAEVPGADIAEAAE